MHDTNRRDFLKLAASVSAVVAVGEGKALYAESQEIPGTGRAWRTTA